jgi:hypothetical protein
MNAPATRRQMDEHRHAIAVMRSNGQTPPTLAELLAERDAALDGLERAIAERDRQTIAATINGPHRRNMAAAQRDAGHLPLFIATNEGTLI